MNDLLIKNRTMNIKHIVSAALGVILMLSQVSLAQSKKKKNKSAGKAVPILVSETKPQTPSINNSVPVKLPNGWSISPVGNQIRVGDLPMKMVVHPSQRWVLVQNAGQSDHSIQVVDVQTERVVDSMPMNKTFYGMCFNPSGNILYATGANNNWIEVFAFSMGKLTRKDTLVLGTPWPTRISPSALVLSVDEKSLYVVTKEDSALYALDLLSKKLIGKLKLTSAAYDIRIKPVDIGEKLSPENSELVISEWGNATIALVNPSTLLVKKRIKVGSNPNEILWDEKGNRIFVACGNDNTVYVIDCTQYRLAEILNTAIAANAPTGSTPNAMYIANNRLYVANADNYNLVVFDVSEPMESTLLGHIPTGWYPTQVTVAAGKLWICNGKGIASAPNPRGPNPTAKRNQVTYQGGIKAMPVQYIGSLFRGTLQVTDLKWAENPQNLVWGTKQCIKNIPYQKSQETGDSSIPKGNPIPAVLGVPSPIKHVFYIIKENRTYDQVLSDVPGGNGDTSLLLFGENITPNQHKLVKEFVLLDNFYVDAEVSADGHNWSTAAMANDYTEKTWPVSYGGKGGDYVYEGQWTIAHPHKGFIWDHAKRAGISYRTYGEFADDYKANIPSLEGQFCTYFTSWDESVKDSTRFWQWKRDFDSLMSINKVPQLSTLRFINDHTEGVRKGRPTPFAHVADNDLAVGMFVDYLSKTPLWKESVVFILEDDAQNGPDHVDAHRSTAYVAGGFVKRNYIDHTHYTTSSMLRTMELILGMSPMSQYDAGATSMWRCFSDTVINQGFNHVPAKINLNEKNSADNPRSTSYLMDRSNLLKLDREDEADEFIMNEVLWKYVKGEASVLPPINRGIVITLGE